MRVEDIFPPEVIDEDIKKWMGGALAAGALAAAPMGVHNLAHNTDNMRSSIAQTTAVLAQTMWGEARSHGPDGMLAVGNVIKNRAESGKNLTFGNGIKGVALKSKQFSCWNPGDPNRDRMEDMKKISEIIKTKTPPDGESYADWFAAFKNSNDFQEYNMWREAFVLANKIVSGSVQDPTNGAYFYHTTSVHPRWARHATPVSRFANHIFYQHVN